jgi:3-oxoacyl-[acyl-carrier-protein] synthase I
MLVVESLEHALARNAKIYAEITGIGATSDGFDMVAPSGEGASRCMQLAMATATGPIDYINAHGTSTPAGDMQELKAIKAAFAGQELPLINSTKSLSGHSLGAAGVQEAIYALIMQQQSFVAASANIDQLDPEAEGLPIVRTRVDNIELTRIMSNSFGFGGTNASLVFEKYRG